MEFRSPAPQKGLGKEGWAAGRAEGRWWKVLRLKLPVNGFGMGLVGALPALEHQGRAAALAGQHQLCCAVLPAVIQPGWG